MICAIGSMILGAVLAYVYNDELTALVKKITEMTNGM